MNKNTKIGILLVGIAIFLVGGWLVFTKYIKVINPVISEPIDNNPVVTSSLVVSPSSSTIDQNNPTTWPRYYFKELGFSVQAPFEQNEAAAVFHDCTKLGDRCEGYENGKDVDPNTANDNMYWFGGRLGGIGISSFSQNYEIGGESGIRIYDLVKIGNEYFILSSGASGSKWAIHPLEIFFNFKTPIIYFDGYEDYIRIKEESRGEKIGGQYYGAVFKLPDSKKFKATVLFFNEKDLSQSQFISILKTIRFEE